MKLTSRQRLQVNKVLQAFERPNRRVQFFLKQLPNPKAEKALYKLCGDIVNNDSKLFIIALMVYNRNCKLSQKKEG